jgi:hypothetical protein
MGLTFDPLEHTYTLDGAWLPGVTKTLKASGIVDYSQVPPDRLEAARERGTHVHKALHYLNLGELDHDTFRAMFPDYVGYVDSWESLVGTGRLQGWLFETRVASRKHRYAGTIDWLGEYDGCGALLDYATGDPEDGAKSLQTAPYLEAAREWAHEPDAGALWTFFGEFRIVQRYAVHLYANGRTATLEAYRDPLDFTKFLTLLSARRIVEAYKGAAAAWAVAA